MMFPRILAALVVISASAQAGRVNVLTQHNDPMRTGANLAETILTPANVNASQFGKLFDQNVDGQVYGQPLYMAGVAIPGKGTHNVVFVVTQHDSVYAFDADSSSGANADPLWHTSFIDPVNGLSAVPSGDTGSDDINPEIGITVTPVIDPASGTLYVLAKRKRFDPNDPTNQNSWSYEQHLHALDIHTGKDQAGSPVLIQAEVAGTGDGNNGGNVPFNQLREHSRPGLLLLNGVVYLGWASHGDNGPYHGWILGYHAKTLQQVGVFNTTPDGGLGGVWMAGSGLAADAHGNIFFSTGNGTFDTDGHGNHYGNNYGDSVVRLATSKGGALSLADYFTPFNQNDLNSADADLGSGGVLLLPDLPGKHPHLAITCGKEGKICVIDRDAMGGFHPGVDAVVQVLPVIQGTWSMPAYFNGRIYYRGSGDFLKAFDLDGDGLNPTPSSQTQNSLSNYGASPGISANGSRNGIVWNSEQTSPAVLHAYDANDLSHELYNSNMAAGNRDTPPADGVKFTVPTIANGKAYLGTFATVTVFGLLNDTTPLAVTTSGSGSVTAAFTGTTQRLTNHTYTITATPAPGLVFNGWTNAVTKEVISHSANLTFVMSENLALNADFVPNPFAAVAGNYSGLTIGVGPAPQTNGLAAFRVGANGGFSGSIYFEGKAHPLKGTFWNDGTFSATIARDRRSPVSITLQLDVSNGTDQITGAIADQLFSANITTDRALDSNAQQGKYTLVFPPPGDPSQPQGNGFGAATVDARGQVRFAGKLGDATNVSQGARLSKKGAWPFYVAPYGTKGSASGVLKFEDNGTSDLDGTIYWFRSRAGAPPLSATIAAVGSALRPPAQGQNIFNAAPADVFTFTPAGPGLTPPTLLPQFTLGAAGQISVTRGAPFTLRINAGTGLLSGTFPDAANNPRAFQGVIFQKGSDGQGLFRIGSATGSILIAK